MLRWILVWDVWLRVGGSGRSFGGDGVGSSLVRILTAPSAVIDRRTLDDRLIGSFDLMGMKSARVVDDRESTWLSPDISARSRLRALPGVLSPQLSFDTFVASWFSTDTDLISSMLDGGVCNALIPLVRGSSTDDWFTLSVASRDRRGEVGDPWLDKVGEGCAW